VIIEYSMLFLYLNDRELVAQAVRGSQPLAEAMPIHLPLVDTTELTALFHGHPAPTNCPCMER